MPGSSSRGIFLSYRREDATPYARLLQYLLSERIPDARVFMDLDSIEPGLDFAEVIREAIESCTVLVALIERQWATLTDAEGRRRLDNPDDFVRFEVQAALERGVRVIPVLIDGARRFSRSNCPPSCKSSPGSMLLSRATALNAAQHLLDEQEALTLDIGFRAAAFDGHQPDHFLATLGQALGCAVGDVAERLNDLKHAPPGGRADPILAVHHPRDGGRGDAGLACHVVERGGRGTAGPGRQVAFHARLPIPYCRGS